MYFGFRFKRFFGSVIRIFETCGQVFVIQYRLFVYWLKSFVVFLCLRRIFFFFFAILLSIVFVHFFFLLRFTLKMLVSCKDFLLFISQNFSLSIFGFCLNFSPCFLIRFFFFRFFFSFLFLLCTCLSFYFLPTLFLPLHFFSPFDSLFFRFSLLLLFLTPFPLSFFPHFSDCVFFSLFLLLLFFFSFFLLSFLPFTRLFFPFTHTHTLSLSLSVPLSLSLSLSLLYYSSPILFCFIRGAL